MPKRTPEQRYARDLALLEREAEAWAPIHEGVTAKVEFLIDGQHYDDDKADTYDKHSVDVRWVGEEAFHRHRHEVGAVTEAGTLTARPVDQYGDADVGEVAVRIMNSETENPAKEFEDAWDDIIGCASAAGYGVGWLDYLPNEGPWGEIIFGSDDPRNFMCDRRVKSIHSPRCRYVIRKFRMTIAEAKRRVASGESAGWSKSAVDKLRPDDGTCDFKSRAQGRDNSPNATPGRGDTSSFDSKDDEEFTGYAIWYRSCDDEDERTEEEPLEADERYMRCTSCGYRTETQGLMNKGAKEPQTLPESLPGGCPECIDSTDVTHHGDMVRVDIEEKTVQTLSYPDGRLAILAPFSMEGTGEALYEGDWPFKLRSFPCTFMPRFRHPFRIVGPSIADLAWWNQIATDMLMRLALERMLQTAPFWMFPMDGLEDARGNRFEASSENGWQAFYQGQVPPQVQMVGGDTGLPAAWSPIYQSARQSLTGHTGIADFSLSEGQSRDIPAASVQMQVKQEEIPIAHYKRRYQRQRGLLIGVYYDMVRSVFPAERLYRLLGDDAQEAVRALAASDLPNFDFHFDSGPDMRPQDVASSQLLELLLTTIETRPWAVDLIASQNHVSPSLLRKVQQRHADFMQQQAAAQAQATAGAQVQPGASADATAQESPVASVSRMLAGLGPNQGAGV